MAQWLGLIFLLIALCGIGLFFVWRSRVNQQKEVAQQMLPVMVHNQVIMLFAAMAMPETNTNKAKAKDAALRQLGMGVWAFYWLGGSLGHLNSIFSTIRQSRPDLSKFVQVSINRGVPGSLMLKVMSDVYSVFELINLERPVGPYVKPTSVQTQNQTPAQPQNDQPLPRVVDPTNPGDPADPTNTTGPRITGTL
jgi:hypothetical protein